MENTIHTFHDASLNTDIYIISVTMVDYCTFKCEYCYEACNILTAKNKIDINNVIKFICQFHDELKKKRPTIKLKIIFWGGEPTLHPEIYSMCKQLHEFNDKILLEVFSNFSAPISLYKNLIDEFDVHFQMTFHHIKNYFSQFNKLKLLSTKQLKNIDDLAIMFCKDHILSVMVMLFRCNMLNLKHKSISSITLKFVDNFYKYTKLDIFIARTTLKIINIMSKSSKKSITDFKNKIYKITDINNNVYEISDEDLNHYKHLISSINFKNWLCFSNSIQYVIDAEGRIYYCQEDCIRRYIKNNALYNINNITLNDIKKLVDSDSHICHLENCICRYIKKENIFKLKHEDLEKFMIQEHKQQ